MPDRTTDTGEHDVELAQRRSEPAGRAGALSIFDLHRSAGNAAVVSLLEGPSVQPKSLQVGAVNDPAEREADLIADQVLRQLEVKRFMSPAQTAEESQRERESETDDTAHRAPVSRIARKIRRSAGSSPSPDHAGHGPAGGAVDADIAQRIQSARGRGRPLDASTLSRMEGAFGADFSQIRIHEGSRAQELNRSLNAQAFTTGSDIFVGGGGVDDRVLAHELAHTVQQGAAVRRFMRVSEFEALTYESWSSFKSTAQVEIIKMLGVYKTLGVKQPDGSTVLNQENFKTAIELVSDMQKIARTYIKTKADDPNKKDKRLAGFREFDAMCGQKLVNLRSSLANTQKAQSTAQLDKSGLDRVEKRYKGGLSASMERGAMVVNQLAPNNGDSGEVTIKLEIPVSVGVFIGAEAKFEAKRDGDKQGPPGQVEVECELGFTVGGDALFAQIQAGLGGFFKAKAKDGESAMKLISYAMYRRCRESSIIPAGVGNYMWGGRNDEQGRKKAEDWSLGVEKEQFGDDESFVEMGGYASLSGKGGNKAIAEVEAGIKGKTGKRYDKQSLENSYKGGVGKENTTGDWLTGDGNLFAQKSTGRSVSSIEISAGTTFLTYFGADSKLVFSFASGGKDQPSKFTGFELEVRARGTMPGDAIAEKVVSLVETFARTTKDLYDGQLQKAGTVSKVGTGVGAAYGVADTVVAGVEGAPTAPLIKSLIATGGKDQAREGAKKAAGEAGSIGLELAFMLEHEVGKGTNATFDIRHLNQLSAELPGLLAAELTRRKRLLGGKYVGGKWNFVHWQ